MKKTRNKPVYCAVLVRPLPERKEDYSYMWCLKVKNIKEIYNHIIKMTGEEEASKCWVDVNILGDPEPGKEHSQSKKWSFNLSCACAILAEKLHPKPRMTDEELAKEAEFWDNAERVPDNWVDAPEAIPPGGFRKKK
jgi:hypothetical protein